MAVGWLYMYEVITKLLRTKLIITNGGYLVPKSATVILYYKKQHRLLKFKYKLHKS